ncbi:MAG: hypothetical protein ACFFAS_04130 [Promethearchaeota archaeon]
MRKKALLGTIFLAGALISILIIVIPGIPPSIENLTYYEEYGSFSVLQNTSFENNSIFYPEDLGRDGMKHPLVIWGDGTTAYPYIYGGLLRHLASHGFIVIGPNDPRTRSGDTMIAAMNLIITQNDNSSSPFYQKIDITKICVMGHSQGASTTLLLGELDCVTCTIPIMPSWLLYWFHHGNQIISQKCPMLLIAGTNDTICAPETNSDVIFGKSNVPTFYGKLIDGVHLDAIGDAGVMRKYITAWCYTHLFENATSRAVFYGSEASIYSDSGWIWDSTNV